MNISGGPNCSKVSVNTVCDLIGKGNNTARLSDYVNGAGAVVLSGTSLQCCENKGRPLRSLHWCGQGCGLSDDQWCTSCAVYNRYCNDHHNHHHYDHHYYNHGEYFNLP